MKRIYHHWDRWECFKAGFYETSPPPGMSQDDCRAAYRDFLADIPRFEAAMYRVMAEWPVSCEQFLTNPEINRIAWLGQAAMCISTGVPSIYRGGFRLLSDEQQRAANYAAGVQLSRWQNEHGSQDRGVRAEVGSQGLPGGYPGGSAGVADAALSGPILQGDLLCDPA